MAEEIRQVITIDTSGAIKNVEKLGTSLGTLGTGLGNFAKLLGKLGQDAKSLDLKSVAAQFDKLAKSMNKLGQTRSSGLRQTAQAAQEVKLSGADAAAAMDKLLGIVNKPVKQGPLSRLSTTIRQIGREAPAGASAFQRFVSAVRNGGRIISAGARDAQRAMESLRAATDKTSKDGAAGFKTMGAAFNLLKRVLITQTIVAAFGRLRQAIRQSVEDNIEFVRQMREVATILPSTGTNVEQLSSQVRKLSDNFNLPLGQVTEGLYQAVSNQMGDAAESMRFLETAAKFAKGAVTNLDQSVLLLSGALNAYGKDSSEAANVAAKFFTTIKLGRTRASELAQSFGRVAPIAAQLGVSFDELNAAFASTTIAGISTSEATTQIRGALNALLKPTEATKDLLNELGFESGEALVQARGLQGALQAMRDAAGGSLTKFSEFIPRVRGMNFALLATAKDGAKKFTDALKEIQNARADLVDQKFELVTGTDAETVAKEANKIKNLFTEEIGGAIVEVLAQVVEFTGGIDNLRDVVSTLAKPLVYVTGVLGALGIALVTYRAYAWAAAAASKAFAASNVAMAGSLAALGPVALFAAAALAAFFAGKYIGQRVISQLNEIRQAYQQLVEKRAQQATELANLEKQEEELLTRKLNQILGERIAEFRRKMNERTEIAKESYQTELAEENRVIKAIVAAREQLLQKTIDNAKKARDAQREATDASKDAQQELSDFLFDRQNKRYTDLQRFSNLQARANQQAFTAAQAYSKAAATGKEEDIEAARAALDRAQGTQQAALQLADQLGNRAAIAQAEQQTTSLLQREVRLENSLAQASKKRAEAAEASAAAQQKELANLNKLAEVALGVQPAFDDKGKLIEDPQEQLKARQKALAEFKQAAVSKAVSISEIIDISRLSTDIEKQLSLVDLKDFAAGDAAGKLRAELDQQLKDFRVEFGGLIKTLEVAQDVKILNAADLEKALGDQLQLQLKLDTEKAIAAGEKERIIGAIGGIRAEINGAASDFANATNVFRLGINAVAKAFDEDSTFAVENLSNMSELTKSMVAVLDGIKAGKGLEDMGAELVRFRDAVHAINEEGIGISDLGSVLGSEKLGTAAQQLLELLNAYDQIQQRQQGFAEAVPGGDLTQAVQNNQQVRDASIEAAGAAGQKAVAEREAAQATAQQNQDQNAVVSAIRRIETSSGIFAQNLQTAETAAQGIQDALNNTQPPPVQAQRIGGMIRRFAAGGFAPRGTDTVPAMLSPGEFVVNARSTRKFFSQLQAINAGRAPVYRQEGGPVPAQTTIGDINVTVNGAGKSGDQTGRQIARSLRRELRRNTSQL